MSTFCSSPTSVETLWVHSIKYVLLVEVCEGGKVMFVMYWAWKETRQASDHSFKSMVIRVILHISSFFPNTLVGNNILTSVGFDHSFLKLKEEKKLYLRLILYAPK